MSKNSLIRLSAGIMGIAVAAGLALTAAPAAARDPDGYRDAFKPEYSHKEIRVVFVDYSRRKDLVVARNSPYARGIKAFTEIDRNSNTCTIHMIDPRVKYDPVTLGHEIMHCRFGAWHDADFRPD